MKTYWTHTVAILFALSTLTGCGGGGNGDSSDVILGDTPALGQACSNNFHQELIGTYKGTVTYPSLNPEDIALLGSCRWDVEMIIAVRSSELGCFLDAYINAPVSQDIVLASNDTFAYQCFDDNSIRDVDDNTGTFLSQEQLNAIQFPHTVQLSYQPDVPNRGPYFGDVSITATHIHLIDAIRQPFRTLLFNGNGSVTVQSSETTTGILVKEVVR